jgi:hypothetical protein
MVTLVKWGGGGYGTPHTRNLVPKAGSSSFFALGRVNGYGLLVGLTVGCDAAFLQLDTAEACRCSWTAARLMMHDLHLASHRMRKAR